MGRILKWHWPGNPLYWPDVPPCPWIWPPVFGLLNGAAVGYEYPFPFDNMIQGVYTRGPATGYGIGPENPAPFWVENEFPAPEIEPFIIDDLGFYVVSIYVWNCSGLYEFGNTYYYVQDSGWTAGMCRAVLLLGLVYPINPGPTPAVVNFADFILWDDAATSLPTNVTVVVDGTATVYNGPYGPSMVDDEYFDCTQLGQHILTFTFTNAVGSMTLETFIEIADNNVYCGA